MRVAQVDKSKVRVAYRHKRRRRAFLTAVALIAAAAAVSGVCIYTAAKPKTAPTRQSEVSIKKDLLPESDQEIVLSTESEEKMESMEEKKDEMDYLKTDKEISQILASMSRQEKVSQLFIVTPEALTGVGSVIRAGETTKAALKARPVGGLVYFRNNLQSPEQVKTLLHNTSLYGEQFCKLPLLLSVDEEGGKVTRIGGRDAFGVQAFPNMSQIGAAGDPQKAYEAGSSIGAYLSDLGFNMDFAPDADVLTNSANKVIGDRSFGSDAETVWRMSSEVARGLREQGIQPVYKHFPGHGATVGDTHEGFAYTDKTLEELMKAELVPFQNAVESGADCIMVAHISAPEITGDRLPASLSHTLITGVLREKLGYDGVVVTDALNMGAIQNQYSSGQAAVMSIKAGADMLLMPADFSAAYEAVLQAVENGEISEERLNLSLERIVRMKLKPTK